MIMYPIDVYPLHADDMTLFNDYVHPLLLIVHFGLVVIIIFTFSYLNRGSSLGLDK